MLEINTATFLGMCTIPASSYTRDSEGPYKNSVERCIDTNLIQLCCKNKAGGNYDIVVCPHPSGEDVIHLQREAEGSLGFATFFPLSCNYR